MSERFKVEMIDEDDRQILKATHDGKVLYEERDHGEPEDNSFYRDWSWVEGALKQAYALGLADGSTRTAENIAKGIEESAERGRSGGMMLGESSVYDVCAIIAREKGTAGTGSAAGGDK